MHAYCDMQQELAAAQISATTVSVPASLEPLIAALEPTERCVLIVWLFDYVTVWLFDCACVLVCLCACVLVCLCACVIVWLFDCLSLVAFCIDIKSMRYVDILPVLFQCRFPCLTLDSKRLLSLCDLAVTSPSARLCAYFLQAAQLLLQQILSSGVQVGTTKVYIFCNCYFLFWFISTLLWLFFLALSHGNVGFLYTSFM